MATELLNRGDAPFSDKVWAAIDAAVVGAAKSQLGARRVLPVEGPYGLGPSRCRSATRRLRSR